MDSNPQSRWQFPGLHCSDAFACNNRRVIATLDGDGHLSCRRGSSAIGDGIGEHVLQGLAACAQGLYGAVAVINCVCVRSVGIDLDRTIGAGDAGAYGPTAEAWVPVATPLTVLVSPESTSVSFVNTLPLGLVPAVPLACPPDSTAVSASATATGLSFWPWIVMVKVAVDLAPAVSSIVYVKISVSVSVEVRSAWTAASELLTL